MAVNGAPAPVLLSVAVTLKLKLPDTVGVPPLIDGLSFGALIADKAFDSNTLIADLNERGAKIVISQRPQRLKPLTIDEEIYKWRHLIENFFAKLKTLLRKAAARSTESLWEEIASLLQSVSAQECMNYFTACGYVNP